MNKLLSALFALILLTLSSLALADNTVQYALIVDAGSTGSRLHLFEYTTENSVPTIQDLFSESMKPSLSSFENNPAAAGASLKKLIDDAQQKLQAKQINPETVTISVLATAGMRLLPQDKQQAIYNNVTQFIKTNYNFKVGEIQTISGKMEGLYGWLDVNYLLKSFNAKTDTTQGSIDMGGASTQIVFTTSETILSEDEVDLKLGGNSYKIFSKSFLGLGLVEAFNYMNKQALAASCYPAQYPMNDASKGSFNFPSCGGVYMNLIQDHHVSEEIPVLNNTHFVAYSGVYFVDSFFGLNESPSKTEFEGRVREVCSLTWEQLKAKYPQEPEKYLAADCANGVYLSELLYSSYQLQGQQIKIVNKINQSDLDWTLGALLYQLVK